MRNHTMEQLLDWYEKAVNDYESAVENQPLDEE